MSRVSFYTRPYDRLEPYDGKLSRTVLRGGAGSNASLLPDIRSEKDVLKVVNTLIVNTKGEGEKSAEDFWVKAERLLYCALIGYIWYEAPAEEMNFTTLLELITLPLSCPKSLRPRSLRQNGKPALLGLPKAATARTTSCAALRK